jgi:hypothetical protein
MAEAHRRFMENEAMQTQTIQVKTPLGLDTFLWVNGALVRLNEFQGDVILEVTQGTYAAIQRKPVLWRTLARRSESSSPKEIVPMDLREWGR